MALSAVYILDSEGKLLIHRNYRDAKAGDIEHFLPTLMELEHFVKPIFMSGTTHFAYTKVNDLYLVCSIDRNINTLVVFGVMHKIVEILTEYFKELKTESIKDNFILIYELLDEIIDYGYPQITDTNILKEYITQESHKLELKTALLPTVTGAISWRPTGIRYKKNEVFVDVIESLNVIVKSNGVVLHSEVIGSLKMKVNLSGMPQLRLGLNDKCFFPEDEDNASNHSAQSRDAKFHQCVQLSRFSSDKTISFIPPDGEFELMAYRMDVNIKPLITIVPLIQHFRRSRIVYNITATSQFRRSSIAYNIEIRIPVPPDVDSPVLKTTSGSANYVPEHNMMVWFIKSSEGGKENMLTASLRLPSVESEDNFKRNPIEVSFMIPYFTLSGIQVKYLKVIEKSAYKALTWVRYITQNGQYQIRLT